MKKLYVFTLMLLGVVSMSAKNLYLAPNDDWKTQSPRFALYYFDNAGTEGWIDMTATPVDGVYVTKNEVPDNMTVIFCRMNPSTTDNNWNNRWNQTDNLTVPSDKALYTVKANTWDKGGGDWSGAPDYGIMVGETYTAASINPNNTAEYMLTNVELNKDNTFILYDNSNQQAFTASIKTGSTTNITLQEDNTFVVGAKGFYDFYFTLSLSGNKIYISYTPTTPTEVIDANSALDANAPIYNLLGVQVDSNYKGVVIQHGKKFIQK